MSTNKEITEGLYASFASGDIPTALASFAEDIHWVQADGFPLTGTLVGLQAVIDGVFMRLGELGDEWLPVPEQYVADGDTVVVLGNYTWKNKTSGEPLAVKMAHVWTLQDGKFASFQQHVDTVRVRELI